MDPRYLPQTVSYDGRHAPGTIVIDTPNKFLYLVEDGGRAKRYGIGVGRPGFTWAGVKSVTRKAEWPAWTPPPEMIKRRPDLPRHMAGGPGGRPIASGQPSGTNAFPAALPPKEVRPSPPRRSESIAPENGPPEGRRSAERMRPIKSEPPITPAAAAAAVPRNEPPPPDGGG